MARALFFQSRVPIKSWGECVLIACFLINRTPSPVLNWAIPFERLNGFLADYGFIRVFDTLCFASTLPLHRSKFHPRAVSCVFLGYPPG